MVVVVSRDGVDRLEEGKKRRDNEKAKYCSVLHEEQVVFERTTAFFFLELFATECYPVSLLHHHTHTHSQTKNLTVSFKPVCCPLRLLFFFLFSHHPPHPATIS